MIRKQPKITVATVVYNAGDLVERTLVSVTSQDYPYLEYIVIDGGSTDGTSLTIERYRDQIDVHVNERDEGMYFGMNKAIAAASGEFLNFMNAGDTFSSRSSISRLVGHIEEDITVIYGDRNYVRSGGEKFLQESRPVDTIFRRMPYCHQSAFARTKVLKEFPFNTTYKFAADYNQVVEMYLSGKVFKRVPGPVCDYLEGGRSESGLRPYLEVLKIQFDNCSDNSELRKSEYLAGFKQNAAQLLDI